MCIRDRYQRRVRGPKYYKIKMNSYRLSSLETSLDQSNELLVRALYLLPRATGVPYLSHARSPNHETIPVITGDEEDLLNCISYLVEKLEGACKLLDTIITPHKANKETKPKTTVEAFKGVLEPGSLMEQVQASNGKFKRLRLTALEGAAWLQKMENNKPKRRVMYVATSPNFKRRRWEEND
eukprot:TRINITY_DN1300_c0_g1_i1.p1 TRINITY_DN1300_c0_g1~~TRINITY_DN1300_c0_g1_i1.p1  ORF type:complete len:182 (-),score=35.93 TRINITY_DN1300_c0_g1_i1:82-627(-)